MSRIAEKGWGISRLRADPLVAHALQFHRAVGDGDAEGGADGALDQANLAAVRAHQFGDDRQTEADAARAARAGERLDRKSTRLNSSHRSLSRMPSSA